MRFDDRLLDEIKSRLRLSDVIGRSVKLRRSGREWVGLSPFAKEKTPSFYVNDEKGFFHDFSSGKHGDLIGYLQETERLSFREAVEKLAAEAGVSLPSDDPRAAEAERERLGLQDWLEAAARWFEAELRRPAGANARAYLERRGLPDSEWSRFRIGYAPSGRTALKDFLIAKGAKPRELVEAGLLIQPDDGGSPYDRFRDRVIFPIADGLGRVVSFGGRALDPEAKAKYLNGPETSLFHKGNVLYGLSEARKLLHLGARDQGQGGAPPPLVVVEGYMDVIACQRAGLAGVAPLGTALTEEQMALLWRLHGEPTLAFDADKAGLRAASRAIDRALPLLQPGRSFRFALLSGGKDADDVLREQGAAALKAQLSETSPLVQQLFERERDLELLDTPERKAGLKVRLRKAAASIADKDLASAYRDDLLARFEALFEKDRSASGAPAPRAPYAPGPRRRGRFDAPAYLSAPLTPEARAGAKRLRVALDIPAACLAQGLIDDPHRLDAHLESFERYGFGQPQLDHLAKEIISLRMRFDDLDTGALLRHLAEEGFGPLIGDIETTARSSTAAFLDSALPLEDARAQWSQAFETITHLAALENALEAAKADVTRGLDAVAFSRLKAERDALRRTVKEQFGARPGRKSSATGV